MMALGQQQFCLKWNNYQTNMSEVFQNMLFNENLVDVTLACEGASLKAHKMVLAACSPFFLSLFMSNPSKHPIVILKDVRFVDLKAIIDFMYRGEVNVSQDQLSALLKTAETLKVKGLAEVTEKQARGHHQLQQALHGSRSKKRRRNRNKARGMDSDVTSESDDENIPRKSRSLDGSRGSPQRKHMHPDNLQLQQDSLDKDGIPTQEQVEPSRILEQSMATAEVGGHETTQEAVLVTPEVQHLTEDEEMKQVALFDESLSIGGGNQSGDGSMLLAGTSGEIGTSQTPQATIIVFGQGSGASTASSAIAKAGRTVVAKFECEVCKLKFVSNYNLKRHSRIHDTERPRWQCDYCDKSFTRRDSLPKHVNFVHRDQLHLPGTPKEAISIGSAPNS